MNLHDLRPSPVELIVEYLRHKYGRRGYEFEIRDGIIWERNSTGAWYQQHADHEWWHDRMLREGWPIQ